MFQHNRQHIPVRGFASASTARKLIALSQQVAPHVLRSTVECDGYDSSVTVVPCRSKSNQFKCGVGIAEGERYFMVRSTTFTNRWYLVVKQNGAWICSHRDVQSRCIAQVEAYRAARKAAKVGATPSHAVEDALPDLPVIEEEVLNNEPFNEEEIAAIRVGDETVEEHFTRADLLRFEQMVRKETIKDLRSRVKSAGLSVVSRSKEPLIQALVAWKHEQLTNGVESDPCNFCGHMAHFGACSVEQSSSVEQDRAHFARGERAELVAASVSPEIGDHEHMIHCACGHDRHIGRTAIRKVVLVPQVSPKCPQGWLDRARQATQGHCKGKEAVLNTLVGFNI